METVKHDVVIPLGTKSFNNKNLEIQIAVKSIQKFCSSWVGKIIVVGATPPQSIASGVVHVPADDIYKHCKDANIIHKVKTAIDEVPDLSDDFVIWSDDQFVTKETAWEDCVPRYMRVYDKNSQWFKNMASRRTWWRRCCDTLNNFTGTKYVVKFWNPHVPQPVNKHKFLEMCSKFDYTVREDVTIFQLYFSFAQEEGKLNFDEFHCQRGETEWNGARWIGYFDSSLRTVPFVKKVKTMFGITD